MNPVQVGDIGWLCKECKALYQNQPGNALALQDAIACCGPSKCQDCGDECKKHRVRCRPCDVAHDAKVEKEAFEKAAKVPLAQYTGKFLYREGYGRDGYFEIDDAEVVPPDLEYAWSCSPEGASLNLDQEIRENALQEHHEDADESVDWEKIKLAQALVDEALKDVLSYQSNQNVAVLLK